MEGLLLDQPRHLQRNVRLDTLMRLRWLSVLGQTAAILVVHYGLGFRLPVYACLAVVALSACLNVAMRIGFRLTQRLEADRAAWLLAFDIAQLAVLLFLTGGLQNPFAFLFLGPVLISATALPPRMTLMLGTFAVFCASVLFFVHYPLPWDPDDPLELPAIYMLGVWLSILISMGFIGVYAWQITEEARLLANALAATELVLAREQHLSQLDGLAAAAAHELGTPLATITVIAKELERSISENSHHGEDVRLLREQAQRCREILAKITELPASGEPFGGMKLSALLEEVVAPHRDFGIAINVVLPVRPRTGADRRPQPGHRLWPWQSGGECRRFRPQQRGGHRQLGRGGSRHHHPGRRAGLLAGDHGPPGRALCHHPPPPLQGRQRGNRARPRLFHRQDLAGALRRHIIF